jgi:hypothetical protein
MVRRGSTQYSPEGHGGRLTPHNKLLRVVAQMSPSGVETQEQPGQSGALKSQGFAQVPLLSRNLSDGQAAHLPPSQLPLQHCAFFLHFFPVGLHSSSAAATPPSDASVPPTRAAPINLSALRREMEPLASPLVSSSKEWFEVCWLTCLPHSPKGGTLGD